MKKEKNVKKDCLCISELKSLSKLVIFIGILFIVSGLCMYFFPKHLCYNQPSILSIMAGLGLLFIIIGIISFVHTHNLCK